MFFFKQKTAYEIKECDWSSDVCSSDLNREIIDELLRRGAVRGDGDLVIITKGDLTGVSGGTNAMKIVRAGDMVLPED